MPQRKRLFGELRFRGRMQRISCVLGWTEGGKVTSPGLEQAVRDGTLGRRLRFWCRPSGEALDAATGEAATLTALQLHRSEQVLVTPSPSAAHLIQQLADLRTFRFPRSMTLSWPSIPHKRSGMSLTIPTRA